MHKKTPNVVLIGTFHMDLSGRELIEKALHEIKPDLVIGESNDLLELKSATRDKVWNAIFEELKIPDDVREKFYQCEPDKEHTVSKKYADDNNIPYIKLDEPEAVEQSVADEFARIRLIERLKTLLPEERRETLISLIEYEYKRHRSAQGEALPNHDYYQEDFVVSPRAQMLTQRDAYMASRLKEIIDANKNSKLCGFFGGLHVINPKSDRILRLFGEPLQNLRFYLAEEDIEWLRLIDFEK